MSESAFIEPLPVPLHDESLRCDVYAGRVFRLQATEASRRLARDANGLLASAFEDVGGPRTAQFRLPTQELLARVSRVRRALAELPLIRGVRDVLHAAGLDARAYASDAVRLRLVTSGGHRNPAAAPAYAVHRDTWYANPQAQLNFWMPLHDVSEDETFEFYPDWFARPIANDSEDFDYDRFVRDVGWQRPGRATHAVYPAAREPFERRRVVRFAMRAGELLVFSAAHLHATRTHDAGLTRFSLDFRIVHLEDHERGLGAPDVDDASTGSALVDYVPLAEPR